MLLQKLVGKIYSIFVEIALWVVPIAGFITLGIVLSGWRSSFSFGYALLGLLAGIILDALLFGPVIILLNMRSSLQNLEKK